VELNSTLSSVCCDHHGRSALLSSWSDATFIASWLIGPSSASSHDRRLGSTDDTTLLQSSPKRNQLDWGLELFGDKFSASVKCVQSLMLATMCL